MFKSNEAYFIKSCNTIAQVPRINIKNIVIVGRSNVGKSSLINALAHHKIAKTSKTPGCTKTLNFFNFYNKFILVDMPGYGYASVSTETRNEWDKFLYQYFSEFEIHLCLVLIDSKVGFKENDIHMIRFLQGFGLEYMIVFTKLDKSKQVESKIIESGLSQIGDFKYKFTSAKHRMGVKEMISFLIKA